MSYCERFINISNNVGHFINKADAKEESITDYIVWKIRSLFRNTRSFYLNIEQFTHHQEHNVTGADIEIVFIDSRNNQSISFVIQAKKTVKEYDSYCNSLNYNNGNQLQTLIRYCKDNHKLPFYLFYSNHDINIQTMCRYLCGLRHFLSCKCLILVSALTIQSIIQEECSNRNNNLSKYEILKKGNPFACIFCCPIAQGYNPGPIEHLLDYIKEYYDNLTKEFGEKEIIKELPEYVKNIKEDKLQQELNKISKKISKIENDKERWEKIREVLKGYKLIYETEDDKDWIIKRVLIIDLHKKK